MGHASAVAPVDVLPVEWRADVGIPIPYGDTSVFLYGDTFKPDAPMARNTAVVGDDVISPALQSTTGGSWYWPGDGYQMPDGSLFVVMAEVVARGEGLFGFEGVDHDAFVVEDPASRWSWRTAVKVDDGPWGDLAVNFVDQYPGLAVTHTDRDTTMWEFDPAAPWLPWVELGGDYPASLGVFAPVHTADGWWGVSWAMSDVALWRAESALGPFEWVDGWRADGFTYDHGLSLIDGAVWLHWSNTDGSMRPEYEAVAP